MRFGRHDEGHDHEGTPPESGGGLLSELATGVGDESEQEHLSQSSSKGRVPITAVMMGVVLLGGAASIYGMRHHGMGSGMNFETAHIEYTSGQGSSADADEVEHVLTTLAQSGRPLQVPSRAITLDPFRLKEVVVASDDGDDEAARRAAEEARRQAERERMARQERQEKIDDKLRSLRVQSVMPGAVPLARINNEIVGIGDTVGELFTITRIEGSNVHLEVDDETYIVSLASSGSRQRSGRRRR